MSVHNVPDSILTKYWRDLRSESALDRVAARAFLLGVFCGTGAGTDAFEDFDLLTDLALTITEEFI